MPSCDVLRQNDRETPSYCADILAKFGQNHLGENIYRVVWSEAVTETVGGMWEERARQGDSNRLERRGQMLMDSNPVILKRPSYKTVSKYPDYLGDKARWVLEKWLPCSYSPEVWYMKFYDVEADMCLSGPYPEHGEFWCSKILSDRGGYMECTADAVEYYARLVAAADEYPEHAKKEAYEEREKRKKREYDNRFDAVFRDAMPVGGVTALYSGPGRKTNRKSVDDVKILPVPAHLRGRKGSSQL